MEAILHQLIGSLSHYLQALIHPRWLAGFQPSIVVFQKTNSIVSAVFGFFSSPCFVGLKMGDFPLWWDFWETYWPTWRIIPVSGGLITRVIVSPLTGGCGTPSKWPFMAYKWGFLPNHLLSGMILRVPKKKIEKGAMSIAWKKMVSWKTRRLILMIDPTLRSFHPLLENTSWNEICKFMPRFEQILKTKTRKKFQVQSHLVSGSTPRSA